MLSRKDATQVGSTSPPSSKQGTLQASWRIWKNHHDRMLEIIHNPDKPDDAQDPGPLWRYIMQHGIIRSALNDMISFNTIDTSGLVIPYIAHCLGYAFKAAWLLIERKLNTATDKNNLSLLEDGIIPLLESWWSISQEFVPQWLAEKVFDDRAAHCTFLADSLTLALLVPFEEYWPMNNIASKLCKSVVIQDFLLTCVALGNLNVARQAIEALSRLVQDGHDILLQSVPSSVIGGASTLSSGLTKIMNDSDPELPPLNIRMVRVLLASRAFRTILATHGDLAITIANRSWIEYPRWVRVSSSQADNILVTHFTPIIALIDGNPAKLDDNLRILLNDCDFVSLIAKCLYIWSGHAVTPVVIVGERVAPRDIYDDLMDSDYELISETLPTLCERQPQLLKNALLRHKNYLITLDQLRSGAGKNAVASVRVWERLGTIAGLDEHTLRSEAMAARRAAASGLVGCSWYKCVMYQQESDQLMHWCMGCKKVVYCGYFCKTRDWDEGHKDVCQKELALTVTR